MKFESLSGKTVKKVIRYIDKNLTIALIWRWSDLRIHTIDYFPAFRSSTVPNKARYSLLKIFWILCLVGQTSYLNSPHLCIMICNIDHIRLPVVDKNHGSLATGRDVFRHRVEFGRFLPPWIPPFWRFIQKIDWQIPARFDCILLQPHSTDNPIKGFCIWSKSIQHSTVWSV